MRKFNLSIKDALISDSSMGNLLKWKIEEDGKIIFVKTSTFTDINFTNTWMYEAYSEVIACRLFKELGIDNVVNYYLCKIHLDNGDTTIGCYSYSFLKEYEKYISLAHLFKVGKLRNYMMEGYSGYINCINDIKNTFNIDYRSELDKIITLDYIVMNNDRHTGNFGFIYNMLDKSLRIAPIFDNGNSLFSLKHVDGMQYSHNLDRYIRSKPFYSDFNSQLNMIVTPYVINTKIEKTYTYIDSLIKHGLSVERANFIKQLIQTRLNDITDRK